MSTIWIYHVKPGLVVELEMIPPTITSPKAPPFTTTAARDASARSASVPRAYYYHQRPILDNRNLIPGSVGPTTSLSRNHPDSDPSICVSGPMEPSVYPHSIMESTGPVPNPNIMNNPLVSQDSAATTNESDISSSGSYAIRCDFQCNIPPYMLYDPNAMFGSPRRKRGREPDSGSDSESETHLHIGSTPDTPEKQEEAEEAEEAEDDDADAQHIIDVDEARAISELSLADLLSRWTNVAAVASPDGDSAAPAPAPQ